MTVFDELEQKILLASLAAGQAQEAFAEARALLESTPELYHRDQFDLGHTMENLEGMCGLIERVSKRHAQEIKP